MGCIQKKRYRIDMPAETHKERILKELKQAGVTRYGLFRSESKFLPKLIHKDEHVGGVIYGRVGIDFVMMVATDKRVLYFQSKPFYSDVDEVTYDVVSGIDNSDAVIFSAVTLHTRVKNYTIRYVNPRCARNFVKYIESRRVERDGYNSGRTAKKADEKPFIIQSLSDEKGIKFIKEHDLAVLSTADKKGNLHGAVVYYVVDDENFIYILTKSESTKAKNIFSGSSVALTIYEPGTLQTTQIQGKAQIESDLEKRVDIYAQIVKLRPYRGKMQLPPVTKLEQGAFTILRISPTNIHHSDYSD